MNSKLLIVQIKIMIANKEAATKSKALLHAQC